MDFDNNLEKDDVNINEPNNEGNKEVDTEENSNSEEKINETIENECDTKEVNNSEESTEEKKDNKEENEIEVLEKKLKEAEDKYLRLFAEFQNFRTRSEKEKTDMYDLGMTGCLTKILPVVDNIERAMSNIPEDIKTNPFVDGIDKVYKQFIKVFDDMGVKPIEALGKTFDANYHNAVMTDEESDAEVDTITEVMLKGYTYKDTILRYSMVKVKK